MSAEFQVSAECALAPEFAGIGRQAPEYHFVMNKMVCHRKPRVVTDSRLTQRQPSAETRVNQGVANHAGRCLFVSPNTGAARYRKPVGVFVEFLLTLS